MLKSPSNANNPCYRTGWWTSLELIKHFLFLLTARYFDCSSLLCWLSATERLSFKPQEREIGSCRFLIAVILAASQSKVSGIRVTEAVKPMSHSKLTNVSQFTSLFGRAPAPPKTAPAPAPAVERLLWWSLSHFTNRLAKQFHLLDWGW